MPEDRYRRTEAFPGIRIDHLRALIQRLTREGAWTSSTGQHVFISEERQIRSELVETSPSDMKTVLGGPMVTRHYREVDVTPSTRGSWSCQCFESGGQGGCAGIEGYEGPSELLVDFLDAYYPPGRAGPGYPPIGKVFGEFRETITTELHGLAGRTDIARPAETGSSKAEEVSRRSPEQVKREQEIRDLWIQGLTQDTMAKRTGWSHSTVSRTLEDLGLTKKRRPRTRH